MLNIVQLPLDPFPAAPAIISFERVAVACLPICAGESVGEYLVDGPVAQFGESESVRRKREVEEAEEKGGVERHDGVGWFGGWLAKGK
jgi:hypothetical protein